MLQLIISAEDGSGIYKYPIWSLFLTLENLAFYVSSVRVGAGAVAV